MTRAKLQHMSEKAFLDSLDRAPDGFLLCPLAEVTPDVLDAYYVERIDRNGGVLHLGICGSLVVLRFNLIRPFDVSAAVYVGAGFDSEKSARTWLYLQQRQLEE